jgi:hypothetical protein
VVLVPGILALGVRGQDRQDLGNLAREVQGPDPRDLDRQA